MKDILLIGATHGDEPIGVRALNNLQSNYSFDWIIGNIPAFERGERRFEGDLNRSAPGNIESDQYASRRAAEILDISKKYKYIIDIHGTPTLSGIFIIITKPTRENFRLAAMLDISRIVVWPSFQKELEGPLSEFFPCGIEIECGDKNDPNIQKELEEILSKFLQKDLEQNIDLGKVLNTREIFMVCESVMCNESPVRPWQEFEVVEWKGNKRVAFLVDVYSKVYGNDLYCYLAKLVHWQDVIV